MATAFLVLYAIAGCAHRSLPPPEPTFSSYRAPDLDFMGIRRVVVLPVENHTRYVDGADQFCANLANELRATGLFEVVQLPPAPYDCPTSTVLEGTFPEPLLVDLAQRFQADGVLFVTVTEYHPYFPPKLAATVHLVNTEEAVTVATVDGVWDGRDEALARTAQAYSCQLSPTYTIPRCDFVLHSPDLFQKFVAHQIAASLAAQRAAPMQVAGAVAIATTAEP